MEPYKDSTNKKHAKNTATNKSTSGAAATIPCLRCLILKTLTPPTTTAAMPTCLAMSYLMAKTSKVTLERVLPFWEDQIAPAILSGKRVLVAAHGNSLRALAKHIEGISDEDIMGLEIPTGQPLVYKLDENLK